MNKFFIVCPCYKPNIAPINRLLAFVEALDKRAICFNLVFVYPDEDASKLECDLNNVKITYLWDSYKCRNKWYKFFRSFFDIWMFIRNLKQGDIIFMYGGGQYLPFIVGHNGIKVYHERTEHPWVIPVTPAFLQKSYLKACKKLDGLFVISTELQKFFYHIGVKNVFIINMIVDSTRFKGLKKAENRSRYIAYCGTASNNKDGVDDLIRAFSIVHKSYSQYRLVIMGKAPNQNDECGNLKLVQDLGIERYVEFTGIIPAKEMPQRLIDADIVALARPDSLQAKSGFPTKLGEYLLSGNPVVVTKVGDIPLFLTDGVNALLSEPGNYVEFANKLIWAIENPNQANTIGKRGREIALNFFNYKIETDKLIKVIIQK